MARGRRLEVLPPNGTNDKRKSQVSKSNPGANGAGGIYFTRGAVFA